MIRTQEGGAAGDGRMESTGLPCASATLTVNGVTGHFRAARPGGEFGADTSSFEGRIANPMPLSFPNPEHLHKLWGSQSWLPPAFSRRLPRARDLFEPEEAACGRLRAKLPAPRFVQNTEMGKLSDIGLPTRPSR
jgi:hypothetical protein